MNKSTWNKTPFSSKPNTEIDKTKLINSPIHRSNITIDETNT